jgi:hypothetical protein
MKKATKERAHRKDMTKILIKGLIMTNYQGLNKIKNKMIRRNPLRKVKLKRIRIFTLKVVTQSSIMIKLLKPIKILSLKTNLNFRKKRFKRNKSQLNTLIQKKRQQEFRNNLESMTSQIQTTKGLLKLKQKEIIQPVKK